MSIKNKKKICEICGKKTDILETTEAKISKESKNFEINICIGCRDKLLSRGKLK